MQGGVRATIPLTESVGAPSAGTGATRGEAEVEDLDETVGGQADVLGFEVDALLVSGQEGP